MDSNNKRDRKTGIRDSTKYGLFVKNKSKARAKPETSGNNFTSQSTGTSDPTDLNKIRVLPAPKTNIIDDAVGLECNLSKKARGQGREKGRPKSSAVAPRSKGISKTNSIHRGEIMPATDQQYYENHGIRIALHGKDGNRRHQARASSTFRNKNIEVALDIVESYAGSDKRYQFKNEGKSKTFICNWIEMAETLAFGANTSTKLTNADWAASGFVNHNPNSQSIPTAHSSRQEKRGKPLPSGDDYAKPELTQNLLQKKRKMAHDEGNRGDDAKQQKHNHPTNLVSLDGISANDTPVTGRPGNNHLPANTSISSTKIPINSTVKKRFQNPTIIEKQARANQNAESYVVIDSVHRKRLGEGKRQAAATLSSTTENQAQEIRSHMQTPAAPEFAEAMPTHEDGHDHDTSSNTQESLRRLIHDTGMNPAHPETATRVFYGPGKHECRILTVTTSIGGLLTLHQTTMPKSSGGFDDRKRTKTAPRRRFLKKGKHGAGGIFDNDPDRVTGYGHDYEPEDSRNFATYMEIKFKAGKTDSDGKFVFPDAIDRYRALEPWYLEYVKQYPGVRLDQWPCGCTKKVVDDGDESEEE